jgi:hypothetical protein
MSLCGPKLLRRDFIRCRALLVPRYHHLGDASTGGTKREHGPFPLTHHRVVRVEGGSEDHCSPESGMVRQVPILLPAQSLYSSENRTGSSEG